MPLKVYHAELEKSYFHSDCFRCQCSRALFQKNFSISVISQIFLPTGLKLKVLIRPVILSSTLTQIKVHTCFSFYKHNAYKHIQPGISEKNKHMLCIVSSVENSCSFFFPVSNLIQRHIQNHVKHLRWSFYRKLLTSFSR